MYVIIRCKFTNFYLFASKSFLFNVPIRYYYLLILLMKCGKHGNSIITYLCKMKLNILCFLEKKIYSFDFH